MRRAIFVLALAACGGSDHHSPADAPRGDDDGGDAGDDDTGSDAALGDATGPLADSALPDAFPSTLDLRIDCHNTCVLTANPARIDVPTGTSFTVNWINVGDTTCDVAKVDQFNHVPIVLDLGPGESYHDTVRQWCGTLFAGTFDFEVRICELPSYIPVDCSADQ